MLSKPLECFAAWWQLVVCHHYFSLAFGLATLDWNHYLHVLTDILQVGFNTADHQILLLQVLQTIFEIKDTVLMWLQSHLFDVVPQLLRPSTSPTEIRIGPHPVHSVSGRLSWTHPEIWYVSIYGYANDNQIHRTCPPPQVKLLLSKATERALTVTDWLHSKQLQLLMRQQFRWSTASFHQRQLPVTAATVT